MYPIISTIFKPLQELKDLDFNVLSKETNSESYILVSKSHKIQDGIILKCELSLVEKSTRRVTYICNTACPDQALSLAKTMVEQMINEMVWMPAYETKNNDNS